MGWGPVGAVTVLRPWAERLVDVLRPRPGERILDGSRDGGVLGRRLARAVGPRGAVVAADPAGAPVAGGPFTAAASLLTLTAGATPHLAGLVGAVDPEQGRVAALVQLDGDGSPHERAVVEVLGGAALPETLTAAAVDALAGTARLSVERLRDVVRFEGVDQLWSALVTERGIDARLDLSRRTVLQASLARWTAADGTLRLPVEAACLVHPQRSPVEIMI